ncbi:Organic solute transport protein 1, putative [Trypanosoma equiperdum]|uniref:Organic solute carrier partner 1 n=2 Tax=Trypanozoon TaxID=39700 RepID=Q582B3_TRYB2|nr:hypothetical protein, conserved [Trypanosoma brucei brucei TREU927]AAX80456.1 hypothetical protein, conserved [Trypanosoma brucei]AAZ11367.1 hypothetical protein, conserved [Trypanosoma brucei brucei TREU927]SCU64713.1 Organic solute transport protein 1, putative [Trypanosoma equiperdum]
MSDSSLVFLILNYGAEMIFILEARLSAQNVSEKTARMVLHDVIKHMYSSEFMDELFRPQMLYSFAATREVFKSLSQTSVMQLSPASMAKLFELMTTGLKYKIFSLRHPLELLELTWAHLEEVKRIASHETQCFVDPIFSRVNDLFQQLNVGMLAEVRKDLLNFLVGRCTPVSLLLESGVQAQSGYFYLKEDKTLPPLVECEPPGTIRYYGNGNLLATCTFKHRDAHLRHPLAFPVGRWDPRSSTAPRFTKRNVNMYTSKDLETKTQKLAQPSQKSDVIAAHPVGTKPEAVKAVQQEMSQLLRLVRGESEKPQHLFKLALCYEFEAEHGTRTPTTAEDATLSCSGTGPPSPRASDTAPSLPVNQMSKADVRKENEKLFSLMGELNLEEVSRKGGHNSVVTGANLLDIMDEE